jgi:hypothetical protein
MSYSRRQLYALGETLGECVTRKEGGRIIYGGGSGGGGGSSDTRTVQDLPEWAKPYAKETLGMAQGLTTTKDSEGNITGPAKYQTRPGGTDVLGADPLQQQAYQGAAQLGPSQLGQQAGQMAGAATYGALGTQYNPYQMGQFTSGAAAQYMNPFIEQAMEPQLREAQRSSEMQRMADQAQATRAGAFGGGRQAIVEAERQRNLGMQQGDIRARGYMSAFDQAQQNFAREQQMREQSRQYGAGLGLQGLQTALQGAGQMGQLGQTEFGQQRDIYNLQNQFGGQQRAIDQERANQRYQDFLSEQRHPYQQLEFMSNILRGTPMGTVQTMYAAPPSMISQLGGLGLAGAGMYGLANRKKGGAIKDKAKTRAGLNELALMKMGA